LHWFSTAPPVSATARSQAGFAQRVQSFCSHGGETEGFTDYPPAVRSGTPAVRQPRPERRARDPTKRGQTDALPQPGLESSSSPARRASTTGPGLTLPSCPTTRTRGGRAGGSRPGLERPGACERLGLRLYVVESFGCNAMGAERLQPLGESCLGPGLGTNAWDAQNQCKNGESRRDSPCDVMRMRSRLRGCIWSGDFSQPRAGRAEPERRLRAQKNATPTIGSRATRRPRTPGRPQGAKGWRGHEALAERTRTRNDERCASRLRIHPQKTARGCWSRLGSAVACCKQERHVDFS